MNTNSLSDSQTYSLTTLTASPAPEKSGYSETSSSSGDDSSSDGGEVQAYPFATKTNYSKPRGKKRENDIPSILNTESTVSENVGADTVLDDRETDCQNKLAIHNLTATKLFPRIKFVNKKQDLEYSEDKLSICYNVFKRCHLVYNTSKETFWNKAKKWVQASITRLRSDKCTAIRNTFYGKDGISTLISGKLLISTVSYCFGRMVN